MTQTNKFFDEKYVGDKSTEAEKSEKSQTKKFLAEPLPSADVKKYGVSKPTRIIIRARIAKC